MSDAAAFCIDATPPAPIRLFCLSRRRPARYAAVIAPLPDTLPGCPLALPAAAMPCCFPPFCLMLFSPPPPARYLFACAEMSPLHAVAAFRRRRRRHCCTASFSLFHRAQSFAPVSRYAVTRRPADVCPVSSDDTGLFAPRAEDAEC